MTNHLDPPLVPRDGRELHVLGICRISTEHQDERSLDDQEALLRRYVQEHHEGRVHWRFLSTRGSGEYLDREELRLAEEIIESRTVDLVVAEDLARICRRMKAYEICETAQDCGTRLIAVNDNVDTARDDWRLGAIFGAYRHESYTRDTGKRIRRTLRNRFAQGGVIQSVIYGYVKPPGARTDADLRKDVAAGPVYDEWFARLQAGATYSEIADWLNGRGIRPGPACRADRWDVARVRGATLNPILKGVRVRNKKMNRRVNKTGRPRAMDAPAAERLERAVPHLAFIEPGRYDRVVALLTRRNARFRRNGGGAADPRKDVPRKRTAFPGQHLACGVCGRLYYFGGHGRASHMMCSGSREYRCWNGVTADGRMAAARIGAAILAEVTALPEFDPVFHRMVREQALALHADDDRRVEESLRKEATLDQQIAKVTAAIAELDDSRALFDKLRALEAERARLVAGRGELERVPRTAVELPPIAAIRALAAEAFEGLARGSSEAGRLARRLIPRLEARPYRLCDGGMPVLRAHLTLDLAPLVPDAKVLEGRGGVLRRDLVVDLFDMPQRAAFRGRVIALRANGLTERQVAAELGLTVAAAQRAAALDRLMTQKGLADPYVPLTEPPADQARMRRHKHARFRFEPGPGGADGERGPSSSR
jgi:site-specific DNA recombinase